MDRVLYEKKTKTTGFAFQIKAENKKFQEKVAELETEAEELRRIRKMLESKLY